jgi:hypothetical protein
MNREGLTFPPDLSVSPLLAGPAKGAVPAWLASFEPHRWLKNGHLQTVVGNFLPRPAFSLATTDEMVEVDPADASRVLCHCHWQPEAVRSERLTVVLVHGLEGSSDSRYIHGLATRAFAAGMNAIRMNMRTCGGTESLTPTLYHSGRSEDVAAVVDHFVARQGLRRVALVGYSMGGNLVLKLAGEWGPSRGGLLAAVATVCPAIDLAAGSDALHEPANRIYEWHFLRRLLRRYRHKAKLFPGIYRTQDLGPIRSIRDFDDKIVAPYCGFLSADDYYHRAASARVVDRIAVPTMVLCAADDPFIRLTPETRVRILANPSIFFAEAAHGGHCAFLGRGPGDEIHWAEAAVIRFLLAADGNSAHDVSLPEAAESQVQ